ncbi:sulfotransferase [Pseudalkalibacillus caeni]|nr:sulfotransferase [Pseudalkalibacillus caeni]
MDLILSASMQRSGSTLLQRIFNARKETLIWGEHNGIMADFYAIYKKTILFSENHKKTREIYFEGEENPDVWIACLMPEKAFLQRSIEESIRLYFETLYQEKKEKFDMIGFKEVRYGENEIKLFRRCYPETVIVFLVRNPIDVWSSLNGTRWGRKAHSFDQFIEKWNRNSRFYYDFNQSDPHSYLLKYEDIVNRDPLTINLISKLAKLSPQEIEKVLSKKIYSTPSRVREQQLHAIKKRCKEVMDLYGYK